MVDISENQPMTGKESRNRNSEATSGTLFSVKSESNVIKPSNILKLFFFSTRKPTNLNTMGTYIESTDLFSELFHQKYKSISTHDTVSLGRNLAPGEKDSNASSRIAAFITRK